MYLFGDLVYNAKHSVIKMFCTPSPQSIARRELEYAQRNLLMSEAAAEYHTQMNVYYRNTIDRLQTYLRSAK